MFLDKITHEPQFCEVLGKVEKNFDDENKVRLSRNTVKINMN